MEAGIEGLNVVQTLLQVVGWLLVALMAVLAFIAKTLVNKINSLPVLLSAEKKTIDLALNAHDKRITVLETTIGHLDKH
ncbi:MAG: hypothetical protein JKX81_13675 [Arenicella sp.]|nr:hypothetical protein [Arenicella sp.]